MTAPSIERMEQCRHFPRGSGTRTSCESGQSGWCWTTRTSGRRSSRSPRSSTSIEETLRVWVRRAEVDQGRRRGLTTDERTQMKELEREVKEFRRANEILKAASAFFGAELDRQSKK
jgi:hypothetical protein